MKFLLLLVGALVAPVSSAADSLRATLIAPTDAVRAGAETELLLTAFNPSGTTLPLNIAPELEAALVVAGQSQPVRLRLSQPQAQQGVPAGGYAETAYTLPLPADLTGLVIVEVASPHAGILRAVLNVAPADEPLPSVLSPETAEPPLRPADRISQQRTFAGRFAAHEPVYFIYGPDAPGAKFQFSFKYRLLAFDAGEGVDGARTGSRLQFGYTQRSLWDIDAESSPFYDSSYMPSLFYELISTPEKSDGGLNWLGFQAGVQHESNGRDGLDSRSLNTLFLRTGIVAGRMEGWHLTASLRGYGYVTSLSDNEDIEDYRGYADWLVTVSHGNGIMLSYAGRAGRDFNRFSTQLDLSVPVRFRLFDFATYFLLQYFNGYGESLRSYQTKSETIRGGFSFVR
jgi:outer membrane phospholipase A